MTDPVYARVNQPACIACGLCQMLAPNLFTYDQAGIASYALDDNTGTQALSDTALIDFTIAYRRCPTGAIERKATPFN